MILNFTHCTFNCARICIPGEKTEGDTAPFLCCCHTYCLNVSSHCSYLVISVPVCLSKAFPNFSLQSGQDENLFL